MVTNKLNKKYLWDLEFLKILEEACESIPKNKRYTNPEGEVIEETELYLSYLSKRPKKTRTKRQVS
jgi:hypothetical protein